MKRKPHVWKPTFKPGFIEAELRRLTQDYSETHAIRILAAALELLLERTRSK